MITKLAIFVFAFILIPILNVHAAETAIPDWIKNTAGWWAEDQIDDGSFVSGIQWLISNGIISIPPTEQGAGSDDAIPSWIKNNAGWWADGQIDDNSFVSGLQWLISNGIMILTQETAEPKPEVKSAFTISSADGYEKYFSKQVNVFGVTILASNNTPDSKVLHVANVFAQYLDNDADGTPDNSKVIYSLKKNKAHFLMCETEDEVECTNWSDDGKWLDDMLIDTGSCSQSQYADETGINNEKFGAFDASLEEVLHLISNCGYGGAYPDVFRSNSVSLIGQYMDNARGGHFEKIPNSYPADAWYSYDDNSCIYNCMITEYFYWAMTSILGAQEDRFDEIGHEWKLNTKEKVMETDPDIYNLLTDPQYKLPTILPDGNYQADPELEVQSAGNYQADSEVKPVDLTISSPPNFEKYFTKYVDVFGVPIYATYSTPDVQVLHAANVLAQYLDNDADGIPDNPLVVEKLKITNSAVPMFLNGWENDNSELWDDYNEDLDCWTVLTADEVNWRFTEHMNDLDGTLFDASLEEILHVVTQCGYAEAYPEIFGEHKDSLIAKYMDNARGGYFEWVPGKYPQDSWYRYNDNSCYYNCMITEYFYWSLTSILGAQDNRWDVVYSQWKPNTEEKVMEIDPDIYNLLTDPQYKLPTILPDGNYQG